MLNFNFAYIKHDILKDIADAIRKKTGIFRKMLPSEFTSMISSLDNIIVPSVPSYEYDYLYFANITDTQTTISLSVPSTFNVSFEYSIDSETWTVLGYTTENGYKVFTHIYLNSVGDYVFIRATDNNNNNTWSPIQNSHPLFTIHGGKVMCGGDIMSLLSKDLSVTSTRVREFYGLFSGCTSLVTPPRLTSSGLTAFCYQNMFQGCSSLVTAPELPATTLATGCYQEMFANCYGLIEAPKLPAESLMDSCYLKMFQGCLNLVTAPELPATTLVKNCYQEMFSNCRGLIKAPELPATTLAQYCYSNMFQGCSSLVTAPELPAQTLSQNCYTSMFSNCTNLMEAPELPAQSLVSGCYSYMFNYCSKLNYISIGATSWNTSYASNWVQGVSASGTFDKPTSLTVGTDSGQIPSGATNGIPSNWSINNN